jgi:thiazole/oxazole-forming peptide maturase SagD family component
MSLRTDDTCETAKVVLKSRPFHWTADEGYRLYSPEQTFSRLEPFVNSITGITSDPVPVEETADVHVYQVSHNSPFGPHDRHKDRSWKRDIATGKGQTDIQAKVSCLAEAIERYSCVYRGDELRIKARLSDLGESGVHPNVLSNFSPLQYANREEWNQYNPGSSWVPEPFDETEEIEWTPNWSLTQQKVRWLPTAYCYFEYEYGDGRAFCHGDSNGCASGNCLEEAVLQGFFELVERDSMALFWYTRARRPAVVLESFNDAFFDSMCKHYRSKNRTLAVLDITTDLGIPAMVAVSWTEDGRRILVGMGAHLDPRIAVSRAIGELNQMASAESWNRDVNEGGLSNPQDHRYMSDWMANATIRNQPYLVPDETCSRDSGQLRRPPQSNDLLQEIGRCAEIVDKHDMELILLDLTRNDVNFPTVRVTVPGLRHFWPRFGPGRLFDVPLKLGWIDKHLDERELNPIPFFF